MTGYETSQTQTPETFEVDLISPMQMEEIIHRIEEYSSETPTWGTNFEIERVGDDQAQFAVAFYEFGYKVLTGWGTLARWQGTSTQVKGNTTFLKAGSGQKNYLSFTKFLFVGLMLVLFIVMGVYVAYLGMPRYPISRRTSFDQFGDLFGWLFLVLSVSVLTAYLLIRFHHAIVRWLVVRRFKKLLSSPDNAGTEDYA